MTFSSGRVSRSGFIAWLLHKANAGSLVATQREFYALKDRLLRRYGALVGHDLQHIVDKCWGDEWNDVPCGPKCWRCRGTRIHRERWIVLERWTLAGRVFHRPTNETRWPKPETGDIPIIEGRIHHRDVHPHAAGEALLWLALLFDRPLFWHALTRSRFCGWQWRPMLALQSLVFQSRGWLEPLRLKTCFRCRERRFIPLLTGDRFYCRPCTLEVRNPRLAEADDDLPF